MWLYQNSFGGINRDSMEAGVMARYCGPSEKQTKNVDLTTV